MGLAGMDVTLPITDQCRFSTPPEKRKPKGFLIFSGGIDKQYCVVMG